MLELSWIQASKLFILSNDKEECYDEHIFLAVSVMFELLSKNACSVSQKPALIFARIISIDVVNKRIIAGLWTDFREATG